MSGQKGCEDLLNKLDVKPNLDRLHAVATEARRRRDEGYKGKDIWREDLKPDASARAKIVPLLEEERDRLKTQLWEVRVQCFPMFIFVSKYLTFQISLINVTESCRPRCK